MKDYYKILGIKENASEEEIRGRWIGLMRRFHPDRKGKKELQEIKAREINEAYQALKDESTRIEYDLKRNYYREKNKLHHRRRGFLLTLLGVVFVVALILLLKFLLQANPSLSLRDQTEQRKEIETVKEMETGNRRTGETGTVKEMETEKRGPGETGRAKPIETEIRKDTETLKPAETEKRGAGEPERPKLTETEKRGNGDTETQRRKGIEAQRRKETQDQGREETAAVREMETGKRGAGETGRAKPKETEIRKDTETPKPAAVKQMETGPQSNPQSKIERDVKNERNERTQITDINRMDWIANEEELKHFFVRYVDRYARKDIDGFLSCFSAKAIQNRRDGLEGIRKIYSNFFNQSREIRYDVEDLKADFYQNGVDVKASYRVDQLLKKGGRRTWRGEIRWALIKEEGALKILSLDYQQQK